MVLSFSRLCVACVALLPNLPAFAAEPVGEAVLINTSVTGSAGSLAVSSPVHRDERIRTSATGLGEFVFRDGTKLAVGAGSSVVVDKFVFNDDDTAKALSIKATKGSFRWISGGSRSSAYTIRTPVGTMGIRGTAFDFYVGPDGTTAVVLLSGRATFCGRNGCQELRRRCDAVVATRAGVSAPKRAGRALLDELRNSRALPFQTGEQRCRYFLETQVSCQTIYLLPGFWDYVLLPTPLRSPPKAFLSLHATHNSRLSL